MNDPVQEVSDSMNVVELHPSLEEAVRLEGLDRSKLNVGLRVRDDNKPSITDHHEILVSDGSKTALWIAPSIRALFRGDKVPPPFAGEPPPAYVPLFYFIEEHAILFCDADGDKTDGEFEEAYSNLRRRPDGKPLSQLQSFLWQAAAVLVAMRPVSAAEYEGIFGRLTRSASTFRMGLVSRNYIETLRMCLNRQLEED